MSYALLPPPAPRLPLLPCGCQELTRGKEADPRGDFLPGHMMGVRSQDYPLLTLPVHRHRSQAEESGTGGGI